MQALTQAEQMAAIECVLFVAGDPVPMAELIRVFEITELELNSLLYKLKEELLERGINLSIAEETLTLCSNKAYAPYVEKLLQPALKKSFSQSLLETLSVIAYRQPITRADVEAVRGVRCEYAVSQLMKLNMIKPCGRKDTVGRPVLYCTTDDFLRHFGISCTRDLPNFDKFKEIADESADD